MTDEQQQLLEEYQMELNGLENLLAQGDYKARKEIDEIYSIVKSQFPDIATPVHDKYAAAEQQAQQFRDRINELQDLIDALINQAA